MMRHTKTTTIFHYLHFSMLCVNKICTFLSLFPLVKQWKSNKKGFTLLCTGGKENVSQRRAWIFHSIILHYEKINPKSKQEEKRTERQKETVYFTYFPFFKPPFLSNLTIYPAISFFLFQFFSPVLLINNIILSFSRSCTSTDPSMWENMWQANFTIRITDMRQGLQSNVLIHILVALPTSLSRFLENFKDKSIANKTL